MFEIGNSLREARLRQNIDFTRVEAGTRIRSKYLQALEAEQFDALPGESYVKGFLRTYAEYLGLDGQLYVDEYNSRFASAEEPLAPTVPRRRERHRVSESNFVVVALAAIVAVTVLVVVAFGFSDGTPSDTGIGRVGDETTSQSAPSTTDEAPAEAPPRKHKARLAKLVLTAVDGDCWMDVRVGSAQGEELYQGTLEQGQSIRFVKKRLWITFGKPGVLTAKLNGKTVRNLPDAPGVVLVTPRGVRPATT